jgi:hypothetical protein
MSFGLTMNETKLLWAVCLFTVSGIAAMLWGALRPPEDAHPVAMVAAAAPAPSPHTRSAPGAAPPATCSMARLRDWQLMSVAAGAYRESGFAVLFHERLGTLTVKEAQLFDGDLRLQRIGDHSADLVCGQFIETKRITSSGAPDAEQRDMRTSLPRPER